MALVIGGGIRIGSGITISNQDTVVAISAAGAPAVYRWTDGAGFGTRYSNPAVTAAGNNQGVDFHPAGNAIAFGHSQSPFVSAWAWNYYTGYGTKYTNPTSLPNVTAGNGVSGMEWSPDGTALAMGGNVGIANSGQLTVYMWDSVTGFGTKYSKTSTVYSALTVSWNADGTAIAIPTAGGNSGSYSGTVTVYKWDPASGFLAGSQSVSYPSSRVYSAFFNPAGTVIAMGIVDQTPHIEVYPWTYAGGFGAKYSDPATLPGGYATSTDWSPDGSVIAVASSGSPYVSVYPWSDSTGFGTKYSNPGTLPAGAANPVAFNPAGTAIFLGVAGSIASAYQWSNSTGFGTKYSNPSGSEDGYASQGIAFI